MLILLCHSVQRCKFLRLLVFIDLPSFLDSSAEVVEALIHKQHYITLHYHMYYVDDKCGYVVVALTSSSISTAAAEARSCRSLNPRPAPSRISFSAAITAFMEGKTMIVSF